jgi:hypothetical protein
MAKKRKIAIVTFAVLGCPLLYYVALVFTAPVPGESQNAWCVTLNTTGEGYGLGDVVTLSTSPDGYDIGAVVLYDWRKAMPVRHGFGPAYVLGTVVAAGGDTVELFEQTKGLRVRGKMVIVDFDVKAFEHYGLTFPGRVTLDRDVFLIQRRSEIMLPVRREHFLARVTAKIGHNPIEADRLRNTKY